MSVIPENHDLNALLAFIDQATELAHNVNSKSWTHPNAGFRGSTLGQHMRHTLDHIEAICIGLNEGVVNYDARRREQDIETNPTTASERCVKLKETLISLGRLYPADTAIKSIASCSSDCEPIPQISSFGRELQFVISHTVHHFAIIAAICHSQDITTSSEFGVAPSTLKHRETISA